MVFDENDRRVHRPILRGSLVVVSIALPAILIFSALRSLRSVNQMRDVYLRNRAATVALQIELLPLGRRTPEELLAADHDLADIELYSAPLVGLHPHARYVNALLAGEALYYTEVAPPVFRSFIPVHRQHEKAAVQIARIETYLTAADFLVRDAVRNLTITVAAALGALGTLAAYLLLWRRASRLERLAQMGAMSAALAHEIRNPLGALKGFVQLAEEQSSGPARPFLDRSLAEIRRLEKLVHDLLTFARPRSPAIRSISWREIVDRLGPAGHGASRTLRADPDNGLHLRTDPDMLVEILSNLIRNAHESGGSGEVRLSAAPGSSAGSVVVSVDDDGPGIPEKLKARLFEPFFSNKASGTGLGLPICRSLAERLNARLELLPHEPRGVTARLTLRGQPPPAGANHG